MPPSAFVLALITMVQAQRGKSSVAEVHPHPSTLSALPHGFLRSPLTTNTRPTPIQRTRHIHYPGPHGIFLAPQAPQRVLHLLWNSQPPLGALPRRSPFPKPCLLSAVGHASYTHLHLVTPTNRKLPLQAIFLHTSFSFPSTAVGISHYL